MKLFEVIRESDGRINFRRENDQHMKPEQKYNLMMATIIAVTACVLILGFFSLID